jgi:hypothetical protein
MTMHWIPCDAGARISSARKSLTLVRVGPGDDGVAERPEEAVAVVAVQALPGAACPAKARSGCRRKVGAGDFLLPVDAVGVARQAMHAGLAAQGDGGGSRNSTLRPPRPSPRTVTVVSPPDSSTQGARRAGRGGGLAARCRP